MIQPEVSHPTTVCQEPHRWKCYDGEATELEVISFLEALVVMLKPKVILETGCYDGYGTEALLRGAVTNGFGRIWSCDIGLDKLATTNQRLEKYGCGWFHLVNMTGVELIRTMNKPIDFAFLDSGPDGVRIEELKELLPKLASEAIVAIHDVGPQHGLRSHFDQAVRELNLQHIIFSTPRGLALVRKAQVL